MGRVSTILLCMPKTVQYSILEPVVTHPYFESKSRGFTPGYANTPNLGKGCTTRQLQRAGAHILTRLFRYEMKYQLDEIKNSDVRREFKEKRIEQEKSVLQQMLDRANNELRAKTNVLSNLQKDKTSAVRLVQG